MSLLDKMIDMNFVMTGEIERVIKNMFFSRENLSLKMKNHCVSNLVVLTLWRENRVFQN